MLGEKVQCWVGRKECSGDGKKSRVVVESCVGGGWIV